MTLLFEQHLYPAFSPDAAFFKGWAARCGRAPSYVRRCYQTRVRLTAEVYTAFTQEWDAFCRRTRPRDSSGRFCNDPRSKASVERYYAKLKRRLNRGRRACGCSMGGEA